MVYPQTDIKQQRVDERRNKTEISHEQSTVTQKYKGTCITALRVLSHAII